MVARNAMPPDPAASGSRWTSLWEDHIARSEPWFLNWIRHQTDDDYWKCGSVAHVADRIRCPVFMIGGWWDAYPDSVLRLANRLDAPWQMLIGPWDHAVPDKGVPGPRMAWPPGARALVGPMVQGGGRGRSAHASRRGLHAALRCACGRPLGEERGVARGRRLAASWAAGPHVLPRRCRDAAPRRGSRRDRAQRVRPSRRRDARPRLRGPPARLPRRPIGRRRAVDRVPVGRPG